MELASKYLYLVLGFLLTVVFGFWLSRRGKPYNGWLFNLHKLIALASVILAAMAVYRSARLFDLPTSVILLLVIAVGSIIALFLSGAFMSADVGKYNLMKRVHNIAPFVLVMSIVYIVYLLSQV